MSKRRPTLTKEQLHNITENMKERIYSTITILAIIAAHWQTAEHHTALGTIGAIAGAVVALWLATIIAARMSYRAVHGKPASLKEYRSMMFTSAGLLSPAAAPIVVILLSLIGIITLKTALLVAMITLLLSLFTLSFIAGRKIYTSRLKLLVISALEVLLGVGVIAFKLALGE